MTELTHSREIQCAVFGYVVPGNFMVVPFYAAPRDDEPIPCFRFRNKSDDLVCERRDDLADIVYSVSKKKVTIGDVVHKLHSSRANDTFDDVHDMVRAVLTVADCLPESLANLISAPQGPVVVKLDIQNANSTRQGELRLIQSVLPTVSSLKMMKFPTHAIEFSLESIMKPFSEYTSEYLEKYASEPKQQLVRSINSLCQGQPTTKIIHKNFAISTSIVVKNLKLCGVLYDIVFTPPQNDDLDEATNTPSAVKLSFEDAKNYCMSIISGTPTPPPTSPPPKKRKRAVDATTATPASSNRKLSLHATIDRDEDDPRESAAHVLAEMIGIGRILKNCSLGVLARVLKDLFGVGYGELHLDFAEFIQNVTISTPRDADDDATVDTDFFKALYDMVSTAGFEEIVNELIAHAKNDAGESSAWDSITSKLNTMVKLLKAAYEHDDNGTLCVLQMNEKLSLRLDSHFDGPRNAFMTHIQLHRF